MMIVRLPMQVQGSTVTHMYGAIWSNMGIDIFVTMCGFRISRPEAKFPLPSENPVDCMACLAAEAKP